MSDRSDLDGPAFDMSPDSPPDRLEAFDSPVDSLTDEETRLLRRLVRAVSCPVPHPDAATE